MSEATESWTGQGMGRYRPYPQYRDSGVEWLGGIPAHWEPMRFGFNADFIVPMRDKPEDLAGDIPWIRIEDFEGQYIASSKSRQGVSDRTIREMNLKVFPVGTVLCSCSCNMGVTAIVNSPLVSNQTFIGIVPSPRLVSEYVYYLMKVAKPHLTAIATGAIQQYLSRNDFSSLRVPVLPPCEQRAIAAFLDRETGSIDALIEKKERLIELLQEKRTALINHAVTKGLDLEAPMKGSGVEWLGEIPASWDVKRMKNLSPFVTSGSRGWAEYYAEEGAVFLRIGNLSSESIDLNLREIQHVSPPSGTEGERTRVHPGDILISITANIGAVGIVPNELPEAFVNQHLSLTRLSDKQVDPRWLGYCVLSRVGQEQFTVKLYGGTKDGLGLEDIRSLTVLVPPLSEQCTIVSFIDAEGARLKALIDKINQAINFLKEYRTALISAAVTGKIDVREETV